MKTILPFCLLLASGLLASFGAGAAETAASDDPNQWLEAVDSPQSLAWVEARNRESLSVLTAKPGFAALEARLKTIYDSTERIPLVNKIGTAYYNFWRDADHPRGIWRRTSLAEYRKSSPAWETVLDLDALAKSEGKSWVWKGAQCLPLAGRRCLVSLSRGGADATVVREFDTVSRSFVKGGFELAEAKNSANWAGPNALYVGTDFGAGSMTDSGYARVVKLWQRGTPLSAASVVLEGKTQDMVVSAEHDFTPGYPRDIVVRMTSFYTNEVYLRSPSGKLRQIAKPDDAELSFWRDHVLLRLRSDWTLAKRTWPAGSLLAMPLKSYLAGGRDFTPLFTPNPGRAIQSIVTTRDSVLIDILDTVRSSVQEWSRPAGGWSVRRVAVPANGSVTLSAVDSDTSNEYFLIQSDFLTPNTLQLGRSGTDKRELLKREPSFFNAEGLEVTQQMASSRDGTKVPYFVIRRKDAPLDGSQPTVLYGYGGFEVSLTPNYLTSIGPGWLEAGGTWVIANIRGGGEFGPSWHRAALKENRQRAYDDFIAVAEDLNARKISSPKHLGIMGGSNGGLLVGAVMVQRPDLFGAVVCQVPLLDMRRYSKLLAGASWMAEYGDPDDAAQWAYISKYSPYQNVKPGVKYAPVFFTTSTRDDRVHPGHARKMVEKMRGLGQDVTYWENTEGGHGGAANSAQRARMWALTYTYLLDRLK
ncbi:prolyl oligopeptidase family serine peptidase [Niveibacterium terrae]|uniref:prolyl oligopeptidase family serine peptidase n=1 Tax=Niveibacterium terrae TaxID=3373598 RepID=UPI003A8D8E6F